MERMVFKQRLGAPKLFLKTSGAISKCLQLFRWEPVLEVSLL